MSNEAIISNLFIDQTLQNITRAFKDHEEELSHSNPFYIVSFRFDYDLLKVVLEERLKTNVGMFGLHENAAVQIVMGEYLPKLNQVNVNFLSVIDLDSLRLKAHSHLTAPFIRIFNQINIKTFLFARPVINSIPYFLNKLSRPPRNCEATPCE